jgi:hypothetical protein
VQPATQADLDALTKRVAAVEKKAKAPAKKPAAKKPSARKPAARKPAAKKSAAR